MTTTGPTGTGRTPSPEHVPLGQTTVPRYPGEHPVLDPAPHLVVAVGADAAETARGLMRDRDRRLPDGTDVPAALSRLVTGWRVLAVGPEREVQAVRAAALASGALDDEIVLVPTDAGDPEETRERRLFCGACHRRFDACVALGDPVACPGCRAALTVAPHHSRRHGAFLGVPAGRDVPA